MSEQMLFTPLFYGDRLTVVNPAGTIGVVTLWSKTDYIAQLLSKRGVDMSASSHIATLGNLFGEGIRYLLRNLLYNPQIDTLMLLGNNLTGSAERLEDFFAKGIEPVEAGIEYVDDDDGAAFPCRIIGSNQIIDNRVRPESFLRLPRIWRPTDRAYLPTSADEAAEFLQHEYTPRCADIPARILVSVPQIKVESYPSDAENHGVVAEDVLGAWKMMLRKVCRFGKKVGLADKNPKDKKIRLELRNFKAVILNPCYDEDALKKEDDIGEEGIKEIKRYSAALLDSALPPDQPYTYGNRLRAYYGRDLLKDIAASLQTHFTDNQDDSNPDNRKHYISLWDSFNDFASISSSDTKSSSKPCLVTVFFRKDEGKVHLTACFRTHNASNAWLENVYGLIGIQKFVCDHANAHPGSITVISYSLGLDPSYMEKAKKIAGNSKLKFRQDPNGYIEVLIKDASVIVEHKSIATGGVIAKYTAKTRDEMFAKLTQDDVFSQISHAIYAGAEIQRAFSCIENKKEFIQDNA